MIGPSEPFVYESDIIWLRSRAESVVGALAVVLKGVSVPNGFRVCQSPSSQNA
jgi:hypothetical protein